MASQFFWTLGMNGTSRFFSPGHFYTFLNMRDRGGGLKFAGLRTLRFIFSPAGYSPCGLTRSYVKKIHKLSQEETSAGCGSTEKNSPVSFCNPEK